MTNLIKRLLHVSTFTICIYASFICYTTYSHYAQSSGNTDLFELRTTSALYAPSNVGELQALVNKAREQNIKICLVGADKSQGGQTTCSEPWAYRISLHNLNQVIALNVQAKEVTVQAGMTWHKLQEYIAPFRLAVKTMQSYNDFSIGGSLSVNVHGQDFRTAPLIHTVKSFKLLQPDGTIITVSRTENEELFRLVIGGYGLFGIIIQVTLSLTDDVLMERKAVAIDAHDLGTYFLTHIKNNPLVEFYGARFSMGSTHLLEKALVITYERTINKKSSNLFELKSAYRTIWKRPLLALTQMSKLVKNCRFFLETMYNKLLSEYTSRNNFTNASIAMLPQDDERWLHILQEYFIPYQHLNKFIDHLKAIIKRYDINLTNITARHVNKNTESMLSYSPQDSCALVLFIKVDKKDNVYNTTVTWTRKLIDYALDCKGIYYLPYQLIGTQEQLEKSYPRFKEFVSLKKKYDPQELFTNKLYEKYA